MATRNCTAINAWFLSVLLLFGVTAQAAQVAGTVTDLNGPLLAKKADGTVKILSQKSSVEAGDLLVTEKETYARIKFVDNSEVTLRPNTQFKIDSFSYNEEKPQDDSSVFSLIKGGLRAVTGVVGKRSRERTSLNTPAATIGIRGTTFIVEYIQPSPIPRGNGSLAPGLHVNVLDGVIHLSNQGGVMNFSAGQFGFTPSFSQPPVILPANPGLQFSPPPSFSMTTPGSQSGQGTGKSNTVDCEVR